MHTDPSHFAERVPCPFCHAETGQPCQTPALRPVRAAHKRRQARVLELARVGRLTLAVNDLMKGFLP